MLKLALARTKSRDAPAFGKERFNCKQTYIATSDSIFNNVP